MNTITQAEAAAVSGYDKAGQYGSVKERQTEKEKQTVKESVKGTGKETGKETAVRKTRVTTGKTIGNPQLSEKAQKYYEQLKKKYANMDFILVSEDKKAEAQANAGKYANANRMVVLIDTEKIERMAEDENFRKQYESIISGASAQMAQLKSSLGVKAGCVKTYGMKVNDGGNASFFAVVDKSMAAQRERIEKKAAQKKEAGKKAKKEAAKKKAEEKAAAKKEEKAEEKKKAEKQDTSGRKDAVSDNSRDEVTVSGTSVEELVDKINDIIYAYMSDHAQTQAERQVGQKFDFSI